MRAIKTGSEVTGVLEVAGLEVIPNAVATERPSGSRERTAALPVLGEGRKVAGGQPDT